MITYSDNAAYALLIDHISNVELIRTYNDLGVDISRSFDNPDGNIMTLKDYSTFYRILYNSSFLTKTYSEKALEILSKTTFSEGMIGGVPTGTVVSHKFGERVFSSTGEKQLHDCGIVYASDKTYILCVMTKGKIFSDLADTIKTISSKIYLSVNKN